MKQHRLTVTIATIIALIAAQLMTQTTSAAQQPAPKGNEIIELVRSIDPAAPGIADTNPDVVVPTSASDVISILDPRRGDADVTFGLPASIQDSAIAQSGETVAFATQSHTVVVRPRGERNDNSDVSIYVIVTDDSAPTEYSFETTSRGDTSPWLDSSGAIELRTPEGEPIGVIEPPWAIDAAGREVESYFTVDDKSVTLHIEHRGTEYPVVADPAYTNNCGIATCSSYWSRTATATAAYLAGLFTLPIAWTGACSYVPVSDADAVAACLSAAYSPWALSLSANLTQAVQHNRCIKLTRIRYTPILDWISTNNGDFCFNV